MPYHACLPIFHPKRDFRRNRHYRLLSCYIYIESLGKAVPFFLVGHGVGNSTPIFNVPVSNYDFGVNIVNASVGIKALVAVQAVIPAWLVPIPCP